MGAAAAAGATSEAAPAQWFAASEATVTAALGYDFAIDCVALARRPPLRPVSRFLQEGFCLPPPPTLPAPPLPGTAPPRILVVLDRVSQPENVGGIFRSAVAFGACGVLLSPSCADPLCRKALRCSMGNSLRLPYARSERGRWAADLLQLKREGFTVVALTLSARAVECEDLPVPPNRRVALVVGNEGDGVGADTLALCDLDVKLRMAPVEGVDSVNVGVAAGVALFLCGAAMRRRSPDAAVDR